MSKPFRLVAPVPPEDDLHASVASALRYLLPAGAVWTAWDLSNAKSAVEGARKKRLGALAGWADLGVFWHGILVMIELKREKHGRLSPAQQELHPRLAANGFPIVVCTSVAEVLDAVAAAGIPLRGRVAA